MLHGRPWLWDRTLVFTSYPTTKASLSLRPSDRSQDPRGSISVGTLGPDSVDWSPQLFPSLSIGQAPGPWSFGCMCGWGGETGCRIQVWTGLRRYVKALPLCCIPYLPWQEAWLCGQVGEDLPMVIPQPLSPFLPLLYALLTLYMPAPHEIGWDVPSSPNAFIWDVRLST